MMSFLFLRGEGEEAKERALDTWRFGFGSEVHFVDASAAGRHLGFTCAYALHTDLHGATKFTFAHHSLPTNTPFEPFDKRL